MFKSRSVQLASSDALLASTLYDQDSFYAAFIDDLRKAKRQVIIESPFFTVRRVNILLPIFRQLAKRSVRIVINTKPLKEQEPGLYEQAQAAVNALQELGILVLCTVGHHRKLAIIDELITWEGSLNILSQNDSCEIMRRIYSERVAAQMLEFLHLEKFISDVV
jgi:phosphatidylserine/phosphatidylglycerophosphate/cardiolipin synthase-like enzyme